MPTNYFKWTRVRTCAAIGGRRRVSNTRACQSWRKMSSNMSALPCVAHQPCLAFTRDPDNSETLDNENEHSSNFHLNAPLATTGWVLVGTYPSFLTPLPFRVCRTENTPLTGQQWSIWYLCVKILGIKTCENITFEVSFSLVSKPIFGSEFFRSNFWDL